ncbi:hypothetical protein HGP17_28595 [Rhizobium sp. P38BS-XIX]|uniref:hypothetical protein n=1 Tax=Rhizobium sp. P38BS-XIX TaxID=2726740 RepID=UPI00145683E4|nr:hypothetical protein [Rhizobium sp. P38BS-XIX]NLS00807.1 hypothetical protein [Rhizobium sp. P38BS-XIX]
MRLHKSAEVQLDPHFRSILQGLARKMVQSDVTANRIVQRTIDVLCDKPELLDGAHMSEAVLALLRRHAFDENDLNASREMTGSRRFSKSDIVP